MSSSARRALRVLEVVGRAERPLGVTDVARSLTIPAGTAFRSLDALERSGYVARYQSSARYVPGAMVDRLRRSVFARFRLRDVCMPYLRQLAFAAGETTSLTVPVGWYGVRIAAAAGTNEVTGSPSLGEIRTLAAGAGGRAILAFLPPDALARFAAWHSRHHSSSANPKALERELETIRERGFSVEETTFAAGRAALAFPVRLAGRATASIAIEGPVVGLQERGANEDRERWREIVAAVEALVRARPALFVNPFGHLDPDDIVMPSRN